jgi:hypothetical protein
VERIARDSDRDFILDAKQALEYGLVDEILTTRQVVPALPRLDDEPSRQLAVADAALSADQG